MQAYLRSLSDKAEFAIVVLGAFGYFIISSIISLIAPSGHPHITNSHLRFLIGYELIIMSILLSFLYVRGWTLRYIGLRPTVRQTLIGFVLALAAYLVHLVIWAVAMSVSPYFVALAKDTHLVAPGLKIGTITVVSIINPVFEELFVTGYVISYLQKRRSMWFAINVSVLIRFLYHLYQGAVGVISIIPIGLIFAIWYARTRRLWPLIVAHAAFDFLALYGSTMR